MNSPKDPSSTAPEASHDTAAHKAETAHAPDHPTTAHPTAAEVAADPSSVRKDTTESTPETATAASDPQENRPTEGAQEERIADESRDTRVPRAKFSKAALAVVAFSIATAAGFAVYRWYFSPPASAPSQVAASAMADLPEIVARVNGVPITREEVVRQFAQTKAFLDSINPEGASQDDAALRDAVVDDLINGELLYQAATDSGVSVTDEEVAQEWDNVQASMASEEEFQSQLSALGHTEETFKASLRRQMAINRYLTNEVQFGSISVSEEEARALYDQFFSQSEGEAAAPSFEEVKPQIENELRNQKARAKVQEIIDTLREKAEIETLL